MCGKAFGSQIDDIRFVQNIFHQPDDSFNQDEVDSMPSECGILNLNHFWSNKIDFQHRTVSNCTVT